MSDTSFCRFILSEAHALVRKHFPAMKLRSAWVWHAGRDLWEFHGPDEFYWHGRASNAYDARYRGWMAWLRSKGIEEQEGAQ